MDKMKVTAEMVELLRATASNPTNHKLFLEKQHQLVLALQTPLREGIMPGDIFSGIFEITRYDTGNGLEYPLDLLVPGTEKEYVAYTVPSWGMIPERNVESDFVMVPTYRVADSMNWLLRYARDARWDVVRRAMQVLEASFVKKMNDDCWHCLLTAAVDRNIVVFDSDAANGLFTKKLVSLLKTTMRRNGGGNSTSVNRSKLTDLYVSPEAAEDMRNWGVDQLDEITRREIYMAADGTVNRIFGVNLHDLDELGEGQEYQNFFTTELAGSMAASDLEIQVGLDLSKNDSFVMPVRAELQLVEDEDPRYFREGRGGAFGSVEYGVGCLDGRRCILSST
jgi:hypothetical protein